ncbi:uncharacterized protein [Leptinotarsa decemlineata]|uniref:uncharacterized protein n=1 Tax=Leptinotarsa decemlineata TaxID=7539 RepID=UPI003D30B4DB
MEETLIKKLTNELKCFQCSHLVVPPLVKCTSGHHFCSNCIKSYESCSGCQSPTRRDYFLENLGFRTTLKCSFNKIGCCFTGNASDVAGHENSCAFSPERCLDRAVSCKSTEEGPQAQSLEEALLEALECPVCFTRISPPVKECGNGHRFCDTCLRYVKECPVCRCKVPFSLNIFLDKIFHELNIPCENTSNGCRIRGRSSFLLAHEKRCTFESRACPMVMNGTCTWQGTKLRFMDHCRKIHSNMISLKSEQEWVVCEFLDDWYSITCFQYVYGTLFECNWIKNGNSVTFSVNYSGDENADELYTHEMRIVCSCCMIPKRLITCCGKPREEFSFFFLKLLLDSKNDFRFVLKIIRRNVSNT